MKKQILLVAGMLLAMAANAQFAFQVEFPMDSMKFNTDRVIVPASPLKYQVLFIGGHDVVETTPTYGNGAGKALAKQWHDFIGLTPANATDIANNGGNDFIGWLSINHERVEANDSIGDGGGMTAFKIQRNPLTDTIEIVPQTINNTIGGNAVTRTGKFFNVDFANTVGETGMNCGGIVSSKDGRIWTAEEWWRSNNASLSGFRDTADFTINTTLDGDFNGKSIKKYENMNYMVEIDPRNAVAIRKQYNWGRQPYEGGAILPDDKTVYLGADATPGIFTKFVADVAGDFTKGKLFAFKHTGGTNGNWIEIDNTKLDTMLNYIDVALAKGASMFNRLEWVTYVDGKIYMTETGRDGAGTRFLGGAAKGGMVDAHIISAVKMRHPNLANKPDAEILEFVKDGNFADYYGRVLVFDPATDKVETFLEGGPYFASSPSYAAYPPKHLSNPDGLSFIKVGGKSFLLVSEDLNGTSNGRVPAGQSNRTCELYMLDLAKANPTVNDLVRISVTPMGAEMTGAIATADGKTIFSNSQHPSSSNPFPYNNSLTYAITGWDMAVTAIDEVTAIESELAEDGVFQIWPNPVARTLNMNKVTDVAIYNVEGRRIKVYRNVGSIDVADLDPGIYFLLTADGDKKKIVVE